MDDGALRLRESAVRHMAGWLVLGLVLAGLCLLSSHSFLLFHSVVEVFGIAIACGAFMVAWHSRRFSDHGFLICAGIGLLATTPLSLLHTLAYSGMGVFPDTGANLPTQLWVAARLVFCASMLVALWFAGRRPHLRAIAAAHALAVTLLILSIFLWRIFPDCYLPGSGLTPFKIAAEYFCVALLVLGLLLLRARREHISARMALLLSWGLAMAVFAELAFTLYTDVYGLLNIIGHLLVAASSFLVYRAIVESTLVEPYAVLFRDLSRHSEELRLSQATTRALLAAMPDVMFRLRADGTYTGHDWLGAEIGVAGQPPSLHISEAMEPGVAEGLLVAAREALAASDMRVVEGRLRGADGLLRDYECRLVPSGPDEVLGLMRDVTVARNAEAALRESERRFRSLFDTSRDGLVLTDLEGNLLDMNPAFCEMLGYSREELSTLPLGHIAPERSPALAPERLANQPEAGDGAALVEKRYVRKDGTSLPVIVRAWLIQGPDGEPAGVWRIVRDISERKQAEDAMRLASVGQLAAGVAHEFSNILAIMSGRAQAAQRTQTRENYQRLADAVIAASDRGARIIEGLTQFASPSEPRRQLTPIEAPIETALLLAGRELENHQVALVRDYASAAKTVQVEVGALQDVFLALIINACQAMPEGGLLTVETGLDRERDGKEVVIARVRDTGVGITPDDLPRIFEPFFTTKGRLGESDVPGTGLGLSAAHGIITAHGGTLSATSEEGRGACFEVRLGAHDERRAEPLPEVRARPLQPDAPGTGKTVLFADDEEAIRTIVRELLVGEGYQVLTAADTDQALHELATHTFDLVIADLMMPGAGGEAVLEAALELEPPPPVVIVTGKAEDGLFERLRRDGATACFSKPFSLEELLSLLQTLFRQGGTED